MNILEFLNDNLIQYQPIDMKIDDSGKKVYKKTKILGSIPSPSDFAKNEELVEARREVMHKYDFLMHDCRSIAILDIDTSEKIDLPENIKNAPYYKSSTKKLPHYFVKLDFKPTKFKYITKYSEKVELLTGQSFANKNSEIFNVENKIPTISQDILQEKPTNKRPYDSFTSFNEDDIFVLLDIVDVKYWSNYNSWFALGCAMKNQGLSFEDFDTYSKTADNYGQTEEKFDEFDGESYRFGTIMYYAMKSNYEEVQKIKNRFITIPQKKIFSNMYEAQETENLKPTPDNIARIFYLAHPNTYVYVKKSYYEYRKYNLLQKIKDSTKIRDTVRKYMVDMILSLLVNVKDGIYRGILKKIKNQLETVIFLKDVIEMMQMRYFMDEDIEFNNNPDIIAFKNGVYDLSSHTFRDANRKEYVTNILNYEYDISVNYEWIEKYISSLFDTEEKKRYVLKHLGSLIQGKNSEETAHFWIGIGRNGKCCLDLLVREALHAYYFPVDDSFYTTPIKDDGRPNTVLVGLQNKRVCMTSETEDIKFITKTFKKLTGNDPISARDLYKGSDDIIQYTPSHKTIIQTNYNPQFTTIDAGLIGRLRLIKFPYQFLDEMQIDKNRRGITQFPVDITLKDKLKGNQAATMNLMIKWYKVYMNEGLKLPQSMIIELDVFKEDIDDVCSWISTNTIVGDYDDNIEIGELYEVFKRDTDINMNRKIFSCNVGRKYEISKTHGKRVVRNLKFNNDRELPILV